MTAAQEESQNEMDATDNQQDIVNAIRNEESQRLVKFTIIEHLLQQGFAERAITEAYKQYYQEEGLYKISFPRRPLGFAVIQDSYGKDCIVSRINDAMNHHLGLTVGSRIYEVQGQRVDGLRHGEILRIIAQHNTPFDLVFKKVRRISNCNGYKNKFQCIQEGLEDMQVDIDSFYDSELGFTPQSIQKDYREEVAQKAYDAHLIVNAFCSTMQMELLHEHILSDDLVQIVYTFYDPWEFIMDIMAQKNKLPKLLQFKLLLKLEKIAWNLLNEEDEKYRTLCMQNIPFHDDILTHDGTATFLYFLGFELDKVSLQLVCKDRKVAVIQSCLSYLQLFKKLSIRLFADPNFNANMVGKDQDPQHNENSDAETDEDAHSPDMNKKQEKMQPKAYTETCLVM